MSADHIAAAPAPIPAAPAEGPAAPSATGADVAGVERLIRHAASLGRSNPPGSDSIASEAEREATESAINAVRALLTPAGDVAGLVDRFGNDARAHELAANRGASDVTSYADAEMASRSHLDAAIAAKDREVAALKAERDLAKASAEDFDKDCIDMRYQRDDADARADAAERSKNDAYTERNQVVAALAKLFPSGTARTDIPGWDPAWHGCVYIDLPTGQASWHYHDSEAHLFADLPSYQGTWDGHSTEKKCRRVAALRSAAGAGVPAELRALHALTEAPAPWVQGSTPIADFEEAAIAWVQGRCSVATPMTCAHMTERGECVWHTRTWSLACTPSRCARCPSRHCSKDGVASAALHACISAEDRLTPAPPPAGQALDAMADLAPGLKAAAEIATNPGFIQARDSEWDEGVNYAKRFIAAAILARLSPSPAEAPAHHADVTAETVASVQARAGDLGTDALREAFQRRVKPWVVTCFGDEVACDELERMDRFVEEVFEAVQSRGYDSARIDALKAYVYGREKGETRQEIGGVMMTLAAWCNAIDVDMHEAGEAELARVWTKVDKIRAKQAAKPKGSALPVALNAALASGAAGDGWQPIETLRSDDGPIWLGWNGTTNGGHPDVRCRGTGGEYIADRVLELLKRYSSWRPTHWSRRQQRPAPPSDRQVRP